MTHLLVVRPLLGLVHLGSRLLPLLVAPAHLHKQGHMQPPVKQAHTEAVLGVLDDGIRKATIQCCSLPGTRH